MATSFKPKILSLDGGGIRGLSTLLILKAIFERINNGRRQAVPPQDPVEPWQYFDLIGGTSTGGIIALMLGRLGMSIDECISQYEHLGQEVFRQPRNALRSADKFDATKLEECLKQVIKSKTGNANALLQPPAGSRCCRTVVFCNTTIDASPFNPKHVRTYGASLPFTMVWEAARATSAATTFFEPLKIKDARGNKSSYTDGGVGSNNPSTHLLAEARRIWGDPFHGEMDTRHIGVFVSLGTGMAAMSNIDSSSWMKSLAARFRLPINMILALKTMATDAERAHLQMLTAFPRSNSQINRYYRFNVEQGLDGILLHQHEKVHELNTYTERYLIQHARELGDCSKYMTDVLILSEPIPQESYGAMVRGLVRHLEALREDHMTTNNAPFYNLQHRSDVLSPQARDYWSHLTEPGLAAYEDVYNSLPKNPKGCVNLVSLAQYLNRPITPYPAQIVEIWTRLAGPNELLPRNLALAAIYMLHLEGLTNPYQAERPRRRENNAAGISSSRFKVLALLGNWVACNCYVHQPAGRVCERLWNFANNEWGLVRVVGGAATPCLVLEGRKSSASLEMRKWGEEAVQMNLRAWRHSGSQG